MQTIDPYQPPRPFTDDAPAIAPADAPDDISLAEFEAFTGKGSYPAKLKAFYEGRRKHAGFNWWALLFGTNWFAFRKLYVAALVAAGFEFGLPILCMAYMSNSGESDVTVIRLSMGATLVCVRILFGAVANMPLSLRAVASIRQVDALNLDNEAHLRQIAQFGQVSMRALLVSLTTLYIFRILIN